MRCSVRIEILNGQVVLTVDPDTFIGLATAVHCGLVADTVSLLGLDEFQSQTSAFHNARLYWDKTGRAKIGY